MTQVSTQSTECLKCGENVAWVGIFANLLLILLKFFIGITGGSKALIADGLHSFTNIITSTAILVSRRYSRRNPSGRFLFGYGKVESVTAAFVSLIIILMASGLITVSIRHLLKGPTQVPHVTTFMVALISICTNEMLFRYMRCAATNLRSQTMMANAWANRADCFSSLAVIVGVAGTYVGIPHLDPIAAIFVVAVIIKISFSLLSDAVKSLLDVSANDDYGEEIKEVALENSGVIDVSGLKTRLIGHHIWIEMNLMVAPGSSVAQCERIAKAVEASLFARGADIGKVTLNIKPHGSKGS